MKLQHGFIISSIGDNLSTAELAQQIMKMINTCNFKGEKVVQITFCLKMIHHKCYLSWTILAIWAIILINDDWIIDVLHDYVTIINVFDKTGGGSCPRFYS